MGGGAFAQAAAQGEPTLNTPRMGSSTYVQLKTTYTKRIHDYFPEGQVASLIEAPEKTDYGDIDFMICHDEKVDCIDLARKVGAVGVICESSGKVQRCSLAVLRDASESSKPAVVYKHVHSNRPNKAEPSETITVEEYAQIDIEIIPSELFEWHIFYGSYSDLAGLLGHIVHNLGFTISDKGISLRLRELDDAKADVHLRVDNKEGILFLSKDPDQVMRFLGLSSQRFHAGFETLNEFYEWLGECRLLFADAVKLKRNNSHEHKREAKRKVYAGFFDEWLPNHFDIDLNETADWIESGYEHRCETIKPDLSGRRQELAGDAVNFFHKRPEYHALRDALIRSIHNQTANNLLKPIIAQHSGSKDKKLNGIVRAFRRWVGFKDGHPYTLGKAHPDQESQLYHFLADDKTSLRDQDSIDQWVEIHWEELKTLERHPPAAAAQELTDSDFEEGSSREAWPV